MRTNDIFSAIETRLAALVHDSARRDPTVRAQHERFILTRIGAGIVALALLPLYLTLRGAPSAAEHVALVCLVLPIVAAVVLARTGWLPLAHAISSLSLAGLIVSAAATSGGLSSGPAVWLVAVPLEAMLSGSRAAALTASGIAGLAVVLLAVLEATGSLPSDSLWPAAMAVPLFALTTIAHAASQAFLRRGGAGEHGERVMSGLNEPLLQVIDDLVTWHDRNGQVLKASAAAAKLVGTPPTSLVGRGLLARVHVSDRPAFLKAMSDAAASAEPVIVQYRLHVGGPAREGERRPDQSRVVWAETRAHRVSAIGAGGDGACAVVAVTRDVSEEKRRAGELDQVRLEAERAGESKNRFLATVSHELRTPLNAIIGFSELLAANHPVSPDKQREYAEIIHYSGRHLLEVVNTLLDISKIESGNFDFVPEPFDVATLVAGCCDLMQLKADQAGVVLARDLARDLPEMVADGRACRQILINLLSNAIKFTPSGGTVSVVARRRRDRIEFRIADTGIGIEKQDLPRLGEPFFQAGSAYTRSHEGTGLGLSVVRGLVKLHRGELTIESEPRKGTTVMVSLPIDCRTMAGPIEMRERRGARGSALRNAALNRVQMELNQSA